MVGCNPERPTPSSLIGWSWIRRRFETNAGLSISSIASQIRLATASLSRQSRSALQQYLAHHLFPLANACIPFGRMQTLVVLQNDRRDRQLSTVKACCSIRLDLPGSLDRLLFQPWPMPHDLEALNKIKVPSAKGSVASPLLARTQSC